MSKTIKLTKGFVAVVSNADYPRLMTRSWHWQNASKGKGYAASRINGDLVLMHRYIMNAKYKQYVDHWNRDTLDNRRSNLRVTTQSQNMLNSGKRKGSSQFKGVSWSKGSQKWEAYITVKGKRRYLGTHVSERKAAREYDREAIKVDALTNKALGYF